MRGAFLLYHMCTRENECDSTNQMISPFETPLKPFLENHRKGCWWRNSWTAMAPGLHGLLFHQWSQKGTWGKNDFCNIHLDFTIKNTYNDVQWVYYDAGWWFQLFFLRELAWWSQLTFMLRGSNHAPENHSINWSLVCWSQLVSRVVWEDMEWWYRMIRKRLYLHMYYVFRHIIIWPCVLYVWCGGM